MIHNQTTRAAIPQRPYAVVPEQEAPEPAPGPVILMADAYFRRRRFADSPRPLEPASPYPELNGSEALRTLGRTIRGFDAD